VGFALLRALAALDAAEELEVNSAFIDVPIVISSFLEWPSDLSDYGIEDHATAWRPHAAVSLKKGGFDMNKGVHGTAKLL
jgi:hypothetical protein